MSKQIKRSSSAAAASSGAGIVMALVGAILTFIGAVGGGSSFDGKHEMLSDVSGTVWVLLALFGLGLMYFGSNLATRR